MSFEFSIQKDCWLSVSDCTTLHALQQMEENACSRARKPTPVHQASLQVRQQHWERENYRIDFKQDTKANQRWVKAMWALCALWLLWKK